ncbi:MAG: hypothetical protein KatS3mg082_3291 [Nitrospiraceae bacterium]|nr:MAG: hypothetical protein KatS3mg082_3291 [Nitrospiraceae bacterium]
MTEKEFELDDPYAFVATRFPVPDAVDQDAVMARCIVEEYALMAMPPEKALRMFASPYFVGTHEIYRRRGESFVREIIRSVYGRKPGEF